MPEKYSVYREGLDHPLHKVDDAVVIRLQDIFAGPALHMYSSAISLAAMCMDENHPNRERLFEIGDYFHNMALTADEIAASGEAKLPD